MDERRAARIQVTDTEESAKSPGLNALRMTGTITEAKDLRYTPGGIAVWEGMLHHASSVFEAGAVRRLEYDVSAIGFADAALRLAKEPLGQKLELTGFIAPRSVRTQRLVVHITEYREI